MKALLPTHHYKGVRVGCRTNDGSLTVKETKEMPDMSHKPVVAITSYAMGNREKTLSVGCAGYIEKPMNPEKFVAEVERCL